MVRKQNRKRKHSARLLPMPVVGLVLLSAFFAIAYLVLSHKCDQTGQKIKKAEQELADLEQQRIREEANWNRMKTPEELEQAMLRHGLMLNFAGPDQVARVLPNGRIQASRALLATTRNAAAGTRTTAVGQ